MNITGEEKISKLKNELEGARSARHKCGLLIDIAMELRHSNPNASLAEAEEALRASVEINFILGKARSYFCMGLAHFNLSAYEAAFVNLDAAWHHFKASNDLWGMSNVQNYKGLIYLRLGDFSRALTQLSLSLETKRSAHDLFGTANVLISMAAIHRETGNAIEAENLLNESLEISTREQFHAIISKGLMEFGILLMTENKFADATEKFTDAKLFFEKQNNSTGIAECILYLGKLKSISGATHDALNLFNEGRRIVDDTGDKRLLTEFLCCIAEEKLNAGDAEDSIALLTQAKAIAEISHEKPLLSSITRQLSESYEAIGNLNAALLEYKHCISLKEEINSVEAIVRLRNQQISGKVDSLEKENKLLEAERLAALHELSAQLSIQEVRSLNAMMEGQERERRRIAADLHDRMGSALSSIKLHMDSITLSAGNSNQNQTAFEKVKFMLDLAVDEVRQVSHNLASGVLTKFGLVAAIRDLCESIQSTRSLQVNFYTAGLDIRMGHKTEIALYRIVQELVNNILKYAGASSINIYLHHMEDHLSLMVEDDGVGFNPQKAEGGLGMKNVQWRVSQLHGKALFDSSPGNGCTVTVEIPIPEKS